MSDDPLQRPPRHGGATSDGSLSGIFRDWLRSLGLQRDEAALPEDLEDLIEEHREGRLPINPQERLMLTNILRFGELRVDDVMVPRADIQGVEASLTLAQAVEVFREAGHSRLPVYRETLDDVLGMIHIKDLFRFWGDGDSFALAPLARRVLFVPPSMPVIDLLLQMQTTRIHMALVVDEYGGTDGLVTIEDLVEQIVGDIEDEYDEVEAPLFMERPDGTLEADARAPVEELEERLHMPLMNEEREEYVDTLGGLVFSLVGRVPQRGELIRHPSGIEFEVLDADPRRIKRLRLRNLQAASAQKP